MITVAYGAGCDDGSNEGGDAAVNDDDDDKVYGGGTKKSERQLMHFMYGVLQCLIFSFRKMTSKKILLKVIVIAIRSLGPAL